MADVGGGAGGPQGQPAGGQQAVRDPLMNVRDRLFHTLFFKLSLAYARGCPRSIRRVIEMMILLKVFYSTFRKFQSSFSMVKVFILTTDIINVLHRSGFV